MPHALVCWPAQQFQPKGEYSGSPQHMATSQEHTGLPCLAIAEALRKMYGARFACLPDHIQQLA